MERWVEEFFEKGTSRVLINPRMPEKDTSKLLKYGLKDHLWLATSGSSGIKKWVALSKEALISSALAVNQHLSSQKNDIWLLALPTFHVGGLGVCFRSLLAENKQLTMPSKWDPFTFCEMAKKATLTALVPTQIFDLISKGLKAPKSLRAIVVGGGALPLEHYTQALKLGWPLLPSFGLTECSSQVATARAYDPELHLLPHVEAKVVEGFLWIKSEALLSFYAIEDQLIDPKVDGWFQTEDRAMLAQTLKILGRGKDFVKINGESVSLLALEEKIQTLTFKLKVPFESMIQALPDERCGHLLQLVSTAKSLEALQELLSQYHANVMPFERILSVRLVTHIPRSPLGKPLKAWGQGRSFQEL